MNRNDAEKIAKVKIMLIEGKSLGELRHDKSELQQLQFRQLEDLRKRSMQKLLDMSHAHSVETWRSESLIETAQRRAKFSNEEKFLEFMVELTLDRDEEFEIEVFVEGDNNE